MKRRLIIICTISFAFLLLFLLYPSGHLFNDPYSTVLYDRNNVLLAARIAGDGQWRFPETKIVPEKYRKCAVLFEDRYFDYHPGFNPVSFFRALGQNIRSGKIISGGSTITMQVARLSGKGKSRNIFNKAIEIIHAVFLEIKFSKDAILALYASHAPYGGNVVGIDAAAWRYFGRKPDDLTWGESATLAVLPNAPSLIHPGKNREKLLKKRNRLLDQLMDHGMIDSLTCFSAIIEPLPEKPYPLPRLAPHLLERLIKEGSFGKTVISSIETTIQQKAGEIISRHHEKLAANHIYNACALVTEVETGRVLAYIGNTKNPGEEHGSAVDVITSPRSTGSIVKPFLYCAMLNSGEILPTTLVPDIPLQIRSFSPKNYLLTYDGAVPAKRALARSLNVPIVKMLQQFQVERFYHLLPKIGITTLNFPADHYGLTLVLGGAEASLWDLCGVYASMARTLNHFRFYSGRYDVNDFHPLNYFMTGYTMNIKMKNPGDQAILSAASIYLTFEAMVEVNRPDEDMYWQEFSSSRKIAWKTGTSFGYRDGWAIGITPQYVVGVWVGNGDGEGRAGLTGITCAAPIMFEIYSILLPSGWFDVPYDELVKIGVCHESGYRALEICETVDSILIPITGLKTPPCPYHKTIHLTPDGKSRVNSNCRQSSEMMHRPWFVLPPAMEWYYQSKNTSYKKLPPWLAGCGPEQAIRSMELIYPRPESGVYIPVELDGTTGKVVCKAVHRNSNAMIYWHLDDNFLGTTSGIHQMGLSPPPGEHVLTLVDDNGEMVVQKVKVIGKTPLNPPKGGK